jgi:RHS repeat-associated protein
MSRTDAKNNTTWYTYDQLNRLTQTLYPDATTNNYVYDGRGNMTSASNPHITYYFNYDLSNRRYSQLTNMSNNWRMINYIFNGLNNRTQMTTPDNRVINYFYDTGNRLYQIGTSQGTFTYSYDRSGRRTGLTYPNGVTTTYTYNPASYLTDLVAQKPPSTVNSFNYTLDAVGNRLSMTDLTGLHTYQYDAGDHLFQAVHTNIPTEQFSYDQVGNRFHAVLEEIDLLNNDMDYTYDYENRLIRVQYTDMDAQYKYDPFGRRIEKNVNGQITRYVYDGDNILNEYDGSNNIKSKYVFNLAIDDPLSVEQAGNIYYYQKDGLGSITELTNSVGTVVKTYKYNSFGEIYAQTGNLVQPFTFTGREYDPENGLYYYRARYYDPAAGIFIGKDPIGFEGRDGNLFRYVRNNPVNLTDPIGLFPGYCGNKNYTWVPDQPYWIFNFNESCKAHDICYGCPGKEEGKSKSKCDLEFFLDMQRVCANYMLTPQLYLICSSTAIGYFNAVFWGASGDFNEARTECICK